MKAMTKIALVSASILGMGALTACQSTQAPKEDRHARMIERHAERLSPEQREEMKQMHADRHEFKKQAKTVCEDKSAGSAVSFQVNNRTIDGICTINFRPDRDAMKALRDTDAQDRDRLEDKAERPDFRFKRGQELTAEQKAQIEQYRAERKAKFEKKRAERQAKWEALQTACVGQKNGQQIKAKMNDKIIPGTCFVRFQPNARLDKTIQPTPRQV